MPDFSGITGFEWDDANADKIRNKHSVSKTECEESFFNQPFIMNFDHAHSSKEARFFALGKTNNNRKLFLVFTFRKDKIRLISARDMSRKERVAYENFEKDT